MPTNKQPDLRRIPRFGTVTPDGQLSHDYGKSYHRQPCGDSERLVIGASSGQIALLDKLSAIYPGQKYYLLYVLLTSHAGYETGRYQSPVIENHDDLRLFIWTFQEFFEQDGRHNIWIGSPDSNFLLVFDHHDLIYAYGDLVLFESALADAGYEEAEFTIPYPHTHGYAPSNANAEDELMAYFDWQRFDLQPQDDD